MIVQTGRMGALSFADRVDPAAPHGWQYSLVDWDPTGDVSEENWARALAAAGWRMWIGPGPWVDVNGRRVRRWSLRRPRRS